MADGIQSLPDGELRELSRECSKMIQTVCAKLGYDDEMEAAVRRLMRSKDLLADFAAVERESPATALRILNAALATLVNSHSVLAIEVEFERRARDKN